MTIVLAVVSALVAFAFAWWAPRVDRWVQVVGAVLLAAAVAASVILSLRDGMDSPWSGVTSGTLLGAILGYFTSPPRPTAPTPPS